MNINLLELLECLNDGPSTRGSWTRPVLEEAYKAGYACCVGAWVGITQTGQDALAEERRRQYGLDYEQGRGVS